MFDLKLNTPLLAMAIPTNIYLFKVDKKNNRNSVKYVQS